MKPGNKNSFKSLKSIEIGGKSYKYFSLKEDEKNGLNGISKLPKSLLVLLENLLRFEDEVSVTKGQIESGLSLGFNKINLLRKIIFPIALRKVLPSYGNELILMVKATSLVSLTTYMEMTGIARQIMAKTFAPVEAFIAAGILYLFLNFLMVQFVKYLEWKYNPHLRVEQN